MRPNPFRTTIPSACPNQKLLFLVRNATCYALRALKSPQKRPFWTQKCLFWSIRAQDGHLKIILARKTAFLESSQRGKGEISKT